MNLEQFETEMLNVFKEGNYFLGCQLGLLSNCYMFIDYSNRKSTERGNIEIYQDGSMNWYYTKNTNTAKQTFFKELKTTPVWFQKIYEYVDEKWKNKFNQKI